MTTQTQPSSVTYLVPNFKLTDLVDLALPNNGFETVKPTKTVFGIIPQGEEADPVDNIFTGYAVNNDEKGRVDFLTGTLTYHEVEEPGEPMVKKHEFLPQLIDETIGRFEYFFHTFGWTDLPEVASFKDKLTTMRNAGDKFASPTGTMLAGGIVQDDSVLLVLMITWGWVKDDENNKQLPYIVFNMGSASGDYAESLVDFLNKAVTKPKP